MHRSHLKSLASHLTDQGAGPTTVRCSFAPVETHTQHQYDALYEGARGQHTSKSPLPIAADGNKTK
eukprot:SAG31_NODE_9792_length_1226_cov_1.643301_1_plen_65_part_01